MDHVRKRNYDSPLRDSQTAGTRRRIVEAATREFVQLGYAKTSMSGIAKAAGVARETVYHLLGGKPAVLKACYDVAIVGDHADVPVADREEYQAIFVDPDTGSAARSYGLLTAQLVGRIGPLLGVLADAGNEAELADLVAQARDERLVGTRHLLASLSGAAPDDPRLAHAVDVFYALTSPELALLLVEQRGWSLTAYGEWVGEQLADQVSRLAAKAIYS
jgi:AcrR family transcriptional regulator